MKGQRFMLTYLRSIMGHENPMFFYHLILLSNMEILIRKDDVERYIQRCYEE